MQLGDPDVLDQWLPGRTIVLAGASVLSMSPQVGDVVGDVVLSGDRIVAVGPDAGARAPEGALRIDASGAVALPGLVDGHVHAWEGALRGVSTDTDLIGYLGLTHGALAPLMTPEDMAIGEQLTALRALDQGVTTVVDNSHNARTPDHADAAVEALAGTGIRAVYAAGVGMGQPADHLPDTLLGLRDRYAAHPRVTVRLMEVVPTVAGFRFATENGLGVCAETGGWAPDLDAVLGSGLLGPQVALDHCAGLTDDQWRRIADSGAAVVLVPRSDPHYGIGASVPVLTANRFGIQESISTDNEFEYGYDIATEMRMLLTVQRGQAFAAAQAGADDAPRPYGVRDALRAATVGGALAAGMPGEIGVLAPGARADVVLVALEGLRPVASHLGAVVNYATAADVDTVVVDGAVRKWGGRLVGVDRTALRDRAEAGRDRLLAGVGVKPDDLRFSGALTLPES